MALSDQIQRRRTFAIIAHSDAGQVKAKGERRRARSDWLRVEQERGISVASSVMPCEYGNHLSNLRLSK